MWVFGSRLHGRQLKSFSDLDLVIKSDTPLDTKELVMLKDAFSESNLPIKIDIVEWISSDDSFKKIIQKKYDVIQTAH